ncbi:RNA polymerase sigma-70 factor [Halalkalibaculum sp. DA3122]|uniref:RNA polymerase sigma-70 factor n=1 Tax=unclassified Halalkalibaculum TaxID=2964617 RepID=UPI003754F98E
MNAKEEEEKSSGDPRPLLEKQWVRRVREQGDRSAFKKIFRAYYKRLHGFARSYVGSVEEAEDIVQEVFLNIWAQRESWDPPGTVKSYLFTAVKNKALNVIRHQRVIDETEDEVAQRFEELKETDDSKSDAEIRKLRQDIEEGINQLPPRCRQIFLLNRRSGLTYAEIAEVLDLSIGTVNTQMGRALKRLRDYLSDYFTIAVAWELSDLVTKAFFIQILIFLLIA